MIVVLFSEVVKVYCARVFARRQARQRDSAIPCENGARTPSPVSEIAAIIQRDLVSPRRIS
jgi:hypothetical protein